MVAVAVAVIVGGTLMRHSSGEVMDIRVRVSSLVFVERNVGGSKLSG